MQNPQLTSTLMSIADDPQIRQGVYDHVGEYCHQCRNCLNSLKLCLYLARRQDPAAARPRLEQLERTYARLERSIDLIQILCRPIQLVTTSLEFTVLLDDRLPGWRKQVAAADLELIGSGPAQMDASRFDPELLGNALDALVSWRTAVLQPGSKVELHWEDRPQSTYVRWREQGTEIILPPEAMDSHAYWTLPMMKRVIAAHSGTVTQATEPAWQIELEWPRSAGS